MLLREAITSVAVAAYARGINLAIHVDNRLPSRVIPGAADLDSFLRRGLLRTIEAGQTSKIALALWLEEATPAGGVRALLEVCRALDADTPPVARLPDLWALPLDGATARPTPGRQDAGAESVLIPIGLASAPAAAPVAARWGGALDGRKLMHVRDVLFDRERLSASMAAINVELVFPPSPGEVLAALRAEAAAGKPVDAIIVDGHSMGMAAVDLARSIRAEPELAGARIVLASALPGVTLSPDEQALFDVAPWSAAPWRRLLDTLYDLFREDADLPKLAREATPADKGVDAAIPSLMGRRILVAEDAATNQVLLKAMLQQTGAEVELVADGAALLERHTAAPADLILMDLQMPGMGGIAAMRRLRALESDAGAVPVIALTAYARSADRKRALDAGMDAYLAKPVVVAEFYDLLRQLLPDRDA
jgi:CheY-like chemotaxis protein